jgi:hypothetical protein
VGSGTCYMSSCVAPVADGSSCDAQTGQNCFGPSTCNGADGDAGGTCALYSATQCK